MKPGRELDALVAEKVMGYTPKNEPYMCSDCDCSCQYNREFYHDAIMWGPHHGCPYYSTDISAAWEVVEKVTEPSQISIQLTGGGNFWQCEVTNNTTMEALMISLATAETAPHAICLAALKAVGVEV